MSKSCFSNIFTKKNRVGIEEVEVVEERSSVEILEEKLLNLQKLKKVHVDITNMLGDQNLDNKIDNDIEKVMKELNLEYSKLITKN